MSILASREIGEGRVWQTLRAGSRTRYLTRQTDNFGFAKWVQENATALFGLGEGRHFGEWWGQGIQRGYGLSEKRFSLFNTTRWHDVHNATDNREFENMEVAPACCHVIPIIYRGLFSITSIDNRLQWLAAIGSVAAPGFMKPEGIVIWHTAANVGFKKTIEGDDKPKSLA